MEPAAPTSCLSPAEMRRLFWWKDHGFLRILWTNFHRIDGQIWRHNHPSPARLARLRGMGAASVLSLRGPDNPLSVMEGAACAELGLTFRAVPLRAMGPPRRQSILEILAALRDMPKPLVIHCKSGSDRTGLVSAIYLHALRGVPLDEARRQLSIRYIHNPYGRARIVNRFLDAFEAAHAQTGIGFEDWVRDSYNALDLIA